MRSHWLALSLICLAGTGCAGAHPPASVIIGSKNFTESVLLAEIVRVEAGRQGLDISHRRALGGSAILWQALRAHQIDAYPEYTGTLTQELLPDLPPHADLEVLRARLATLGLGLSAPLGFEDGYALGVRADTAQAAGLQRLSDLPAHPELRYGLSNEFMDRGDGWPGLRAAYGLVPDGLASKRVQGMDHDLAYRALADGAIDVIDVYTTDAEIEAGHLRLLDDDRHYFPGYQAVVLYRLDTARQTPALIATLATLADRISAVDMRGLNGEVKLHGRDEHDVAATFLGQSSAAPAFGLGALAARVAQRTVEHLTLVGISLGLAVLLGLPLGVLAAARPAAGQALLAATAILQTIPALAMLVFLIPLLGIGARPAVAALFFYSLLPIVRNTVAGLDAIDPDLRNSARALGLPARVRLMRIELPLAAETILAGISTAAVINVGTATLGALIGAGGYGQPILTGVRLGNFGLILEGAIPAAVLALVVQALFNLLRQILAPHTSALRPNRAE